MNHLSNIFGKNGDGIGDLTERKKLIHKLMENKKYQINSGLKNALNYRFPSLGSSKAE